MLADAAPVSLSKSDIEKIDQFPAIVVADILQKIREADPMMLMARLLSATVIRTMDEKVEL